MGDSRRDVRGRGGVGERALGVLFGDGRGRDFGDLAVEHAEPGEREGVNLDRDILAELDEADVGVSDQRLDLQASRRSA